jgi:thiol-disulfide isomerase/thioredoxin
MKIVASIITVLALISLPLFGLGPASVGKMAPNFKLKNIKNGEDISLQDYRGKTVILDFWATWCAPCKESLPELERLARENQSLSVLTVNIDDKRDNAIRFLNKYDLQLTAVFDKNKDVVGMYEIPAMPSAIIIDKEGYIRYLHLGYNKNHFEEIQKEVREIQ